MYSPVISISFSNLPVMNEVSEASPVIGQVVLNFKSKKPFLLHFHWALGIIEQGIYLHAFWFVEFRQIYDRYCWQWAGI